jgi:hypothetical protein
VRYRLSCLDPDVLMRASYVFLQPQNPLITQDLLPNFASFLVYLSQNPLPRLVMPFSSDLIIVFCAALIVISYAVYTSPQLFSEFLFDVRFPVPALHLVDVCLRPLSIVVLHAQAFFVIFIIAFFFQVLLLFHSFPPPTQMVFR